jgi:thiosulfate/3-mercaptopyruvate sulfurtransferase
MAQDRGQFLVETSWLAEHLHDADVRVVDLRGHVKIVTLDASSGLQEAHYLGAREEYEQEHIPGAVYADWTRDIADPEGDIEAQIASPEQFSAVMGRLGIGDQHLVVAYDAHPASQFATRLWWALNYYGHSRVVVLNGGFLKWKREKRPVEGALPTYPPATFTPVVQPQLRATAEDVLAFLQQRNMNIVDARDSGQYTGQIARLSKGGEGRHGHIPGAISLPREELIDPTTGTFRSNAELQQIFDAAKISSDQHIVAYCNGGVAATTILFSLAMLGYTHLTNYDGSWNEWGVRRDLPVEV